MANRAIDSQTARDALAAVLVVGGVVATSLGAFLVSPTAGFLVVGGQMLALGVALGWGEKEGAEEEEAGGGEPDEERALQLVRTQEGEPVPQPEPAPRRRPSTRHPSVSMSTGPTFVPIASYLGIGAPAPARPDAGAETDAATPDQGYVNPTDTNPTGGDTE